MSIVAPIISVSILISSAVADFRNNSVSIVPRAIALILILMLYGVYSVSPKIPALAVV